MKELLDNTMCSLGLSMKGGGTFSCGEKVGVKEKNLRELFQAKDISHGI
jgi:hypothetical protein